MIDYIQENPHAFWFTVGFVLLAIEIGFLGLASGIVLFAGIGALVTGAMLWLGWLPETWLAGIASFGISAFASAVVLWRPLLRLQNYRTPAKDNSSDLVGYRFVLDGPIAPGTPASTRYSGIEWRVELEPGGPVDRLESGALVEVRSVDAGVFRVAPADAVAKGVR